MRSTHWSHLSHVPEPLRATMGRLHGAWSSQDLAIESTLVLCAGAEAQNIASTVQARLNPIRIPLFVDQLLTVHPEIRLRTAFRAIALFLGVGEHYVRKSYYRRPR